MVATVYQVPDKLIANRRLNRIESLKAWMAEADISTSISIAGYFRAAENFAGRLS